VLISELLADPASDWDGDGTLSSRGDEWVEILNTGPGTVDLADYYLRDALGDDPQIRFSGLLAVGEVAVFHGSAAEAWQAAEGLSSTGLSLNNAGDMLELAVASRPALLAASVKDGFLSYEGYALPQYIAATPCCTAHGRRWM